MPVAAWSIDTYMWPQMISDADYFAQQFVFENNPNGDDGAYMGLQQQGDGRQNARFSIWNATAARMSQVDGAQCEEYGHEGSGWTCTIPYVFGTGRWYRFRLRILNENAQGRWWGAWIIDDAGNEQHIGSIRAPRGTGLINGTVSFNEYFGAASGCGAPHLPPSSVYVFNPVLNAGSSRAGIGTPSTLRCSEGRVTSLWNGTLSRLELHYERVLGPSPQNPPYPSGVGLTPDQYERYRNTWTATTTPSTLTGGDARTPGPASFTDHPLGPGATPVRAIHFRELRARIAALRVREDLPAVRWTDPVLTPGVTPVRRVHLTELRTALDAVYDAAGSPRPNYTDAVVVAGATAVKAEHLLELRAAVAALEERR